MSELKQKAYQQHSKRKTRKECRSQVQTTLPPSILLSLLPNVFVILRIDIGVPARRDGGVGGLEAGYASDIDICALVISSSGSSSIEEELVENDVERECGFESKWEFDRGRDSE